MVEKKKNNPFVFILVGSIILFVGFLVFLFVYKSSHETFTSKNLIIDAIVGVVFLGGVSLGSWFLINRDEKMKDKFKKEASTLPESISLEECREIRDKEILEQHENYIKSPIYEETPSIGTGVKSTIYLCLAEGLYDDPYASENYPTYFFALNTHYPDKKMDLIKNPSPQAIEKVISRLASFPEGEPDVKETTEENPILGTRRTTKEVVHKKSEKDNKKPKEDLVEEEEA